MGINSFVGKFARLFAIARNRTWTGRKTELEEEWVRDPNSDAQDNVETSPPDDESVELCCVWGIEFYTPTHTPRLIEDLRKLGWGDSDQIDRGRDPETWLKGLRNRQFGGASWNLGYIVPKGAKLPFMGIDRHESSLPASVKYANAGMYAISPSLVAVVMCFVLDEHMSRTFDEILRTYRQTYTTPVKRGWRIHDPYSQKTEHIERTRAKLTEQTRNWFAEHLPGLFCAKALGHHLPTCEFVTLRKAEPFPASAEGNHHLLGYLGVLGVSRDFDVWRSSGVPGLKLRLPNGLENGLPYHAILAVNEARHKSALPDGFHDASMESRVSHIDRCMQKLLALWSILPMLEGYTKHLNVVRDSIASSPQPHHAPARALDELVMEMAFSVDIAAVTSELKAHTEEHYPFMHGIERFEPFDSQFYEPGTNLGQRLEAVIGKQVSWLQRTDGAVRDQLAQYGTLLGATESVHVQRRIQWLTWVLVVLTLVVLFAALVPEGWIIRLCQEILAQLKLPLVHWR